VHNVNWHQNSLTAFNIVLVAQTDTSTTSKLQTFIVHQIHGTCQHSLRRANSKWHALLMDAVAMHLHLLVLATAFFRFSQHHLSCH